jgi:hypothetical protein
MDAGEPQAWMPALPVASKKSSRRCQPLEALVLEALQLLLALVHTKHFVMG